MTYETLHWALAGPGACALRFVLSHPSSARVPRSEGRRDHPPSPRAVGGCALSFGGFLALCGAEWPDPRWGGGPGRPGIPEFVTRVVSGFHGSFEILPQEDVCQGGLSVSEPRAATPVCECAGCVPVCACARPGKGRMEPVRHFLRGGAGSAACGAGPGSQGSPASQPGPRRHPRTSSRAFLPARATGTVNPGR